MDDRRGIVVEPSFRFRIDLPKTSYRQCLAQNSRSLSMMTIHGFPAVRCNPAHLSVVVEVRNNSSSDGGGDGGDGEIEGGVAVGGGVFSLAGGVVYCCCCYQGEQECQLLEG
mmetsp:Transcript_22079/g.41392  ORF Transcript_22079/g.41392 Transcript_22079/m.41392 type:complete len:112 (-) Transcript_22079:665-1000(-)